MQNKDLVSIMTHWNSFIELIGDYLNYKDNDLSIQNSDDLFDSDKRIKLSIDKEKINIEYWESECVSDSCSGGYWDEVQKIETIKLKDLISWNLEDKANFDPYERIKELEERLSKETGLRRELERSRP